MFNSNTVVLKFKTYYISYRIWFWFYWFIMFTATVNNISAISWRSALFVVETGVPGENYRPVPIY